MPGFRFSAVDADGQAFSGRLEAIDAADALRQLRERGVVPFQIDPDAAPAAGAVPSVGRRLGRADWTALVREFATLMTARVPLNEAVEALAEGYAGTAVAESLQVLGRELRAGKGFHDACRAAALPLPDYFFQLARAGELSGELADALRAAADQMEYDVQVRQELIGAITYPAILVSVGTIAIFIIFVAVVPNFATLLKGHNVDVPTLSRWVISAGLFARENLLGLGMAMGSVAALSVVALSRPAGRLWFAEQLWRLRFVGPWLRDAGLTAWAAVMATLLEHRVPLVDALELAADGVRLRPLRAALRQILQDVRNGRRIGDSVAALGLGNRSAVTMLKAGEKAGELDQAFRVLARMLGDQGRARTKRFLTVIEPVAIIAIGIVIGTIMAAVMMAMAALNSAPL